MSLLDRIRPFLQRDIARRPPFCVGEHRVGWVDPALAERLRGFPETFVVSGDAVRLSPRLADFDARTRAVDSVLRRLRGDGLFPAWRDEAYAVGTDFHAPPLLQIERAAVPSFGTRAYGIHLNGYVGRGDAMRLWVGRRSRHKHAWPGKLDHLVAGGQPIGLSLTDNLLKEAAEEASLPADLARQAHPVGAITYLTTNEEGLRNDVVFAYDLELPADFQPVNQDGEVEEFFLWPIERVVEVLAKTDDFKFNVALVNIDFLLRHGFIGPEDPDYLDIIAGLRSHPDFMPVSGDSP
ncbi:MAG TPA: DUF4743 domain-containing protein [Methylomirabilota bacterium]|nr:DUF4743 domain-containing protein [Methylomirabilota bacterium]